MVSTSKRYVVRASRLLVALAAAGLCVALADRPAFAAGATVEGDGAYTAPGGIIAAVADVKAAQIAVQQTVNQSGMETRTSVDSSVQQAGSAVVATLRDQTTAIQQMLASAIKQIAAIDARQAAFQSRLAIQQNYGNAPPTVCSEANMAAGTVAGSNGKQTTNAVLNQGIQQWEGSKQRLAQEIATGSQLQADQLEAGTLTTAAPTANQVKAQQVLLNRLVDFTPPPKLPKAEARTPAGIVYGSVANDRQMRLSTMSSVLTHEAADATPTYPLSNWLQSVLQDSGYASTPEGKQALASADQNGGKISYDQLLKLLVNSKSPMDTGYLKEIEGMQSPDLLRELILQVATNNMLSLARLRLAQRVAVMDASTQANTVNQSMNSTLDKLRTRAETLTPSN